MRKLEKFSNDLGFSVKDFQQDWGIENSDPKRILEFIAYYESQDELSNNESEALSQLIFQSTEEYFKKNYDKTLESKFLKFIYLHNSEFPIELEYWKNLDSKNWTIPVLLKKLKI